MVFVKFQSFICITYDDLWQPENKNPLQKPVFLPPSYRSLVCSLPVAALLNGRRKAETDFLKRPKTKYCNDHHSTLRGRMTMQVLQSLHEICKMNLQPSGIS